MNIKMTVDGFHPETGERVRGGTALFHERQLRDQIEDVLASLCDHYTDTEAERRPVVVIRIEYL
jgi:hypothetical protein